MSVNNLWWNRVRYSLYAPFYNLMKPIFASMRSRSIAKLQLQEGERVLLLGVGTGLDLDFLPSGVEITAVDLSPLMVARSRGRAKKLGLNYRAEAMNASSLNLPCDYYDAVILHLILAVLPDPFACAAEVHRVLKPQGRICILDKFLPDGERPPLLRRLLNLFTNFFFSDLNRQLGPILEAGSFKVAEREDGLLGGAFQILLVKH